jgi:hypothetical protein
MHFNLLGVQLQFDSDENEFIEYLRHFVCLPIKESKDLDPHIHVNFFLNKKIEKLDDYQKIARNIWLKKDAIFLSEIEKCPGLQIKLRRKNNKLFLDAYFYHATARLKDKMFSHFKFNKISREFRLISFTYYLVYYPFFYYLERFCGLCLLHAAAVEYNKIGVLIPGLGGIGKSTISLGSLASNGYRFISDNIILFNKEKIYPFPEYIGLDAKSLGMLAKLKDLLIPQKSIVFSHNRVYYHLKQSSTSREADPKYLFWLQLSNINQVLPLNKETCAKYLLNMNLLAKELREYYVIASAIDLAFSCSLSPNTYFNRFTRFLSGIDCYILQYTGDEDIEHIFKETISKIIQ